MMRLLLSSQEQGQGARGLGGLGGGGGGGGLVKQIAYDGKLYMYMQAIVMSA